MPDKDNANPDIIVRAALIRLLALQATSLHEIGVWLNGAMIIGQLDLSFAKCRGTLTLMNCRFAEQPLMAQAELAQLSLERSHFPGLFAQGATVTGGVFLRGVTATGTVHMAGAQISGAFACEVAKLDGGGGDALNAQGAKVTGGVSLQGVTATGTVDIAGAQIGGQLACDGAILNGGKGKALNAQGATVTGSVFLRGVTATGTVNVVRAQISGQVVCEGATLDGGKGMALNAQAIRVDEGFLFGAVKAVTGRVDLTSAHVHNLVDDVASWGKCRDVILDGFTYDRIGGDTAPSFAARKDWLKKGSRFEGEFRPQPYTRFAKVMRAAGHAGEARKALMARDQALAFEARKIKGPLDYLAFPLCWLWDFLLRHVAGYGFAPLRSLVVLGGLLVLAWGMAYATWNEGSFAPNSDVILVSQGWQDVLAKDCLPAPAAKDCTRNPGKVWSDDPQAGMDWDSFNAFGYAADLVVPVLDLGQTSAWAPSKDRGPWGWGLWWGRWAFAALGWLVTALGAAAVTGVIQRNSPE